MTIKRVYEQATDSLGEIADEAAGRREEILGARHRCEYKIHVVLEPGTKQNRKFSTTWYGKVVANGVSDSVRINRKSNPIPGISAGVQID